MRILTVLIGFLVTSSVSAQSIDDQVVGFGMLGLALDAPHVPEGKSAAVRIGGAYGWAEDGGLDIDGDGGAVGLSLGVRINDATQFDAGGAIDTEWQNSQAVRGGLTFNF